MTLPIRARVGSSLVVVLALLAASTTALLGPASAAASSYGELIVRHSAPPASALATQFAHVPAARSFLLVVTEPTRAPLRFSWALHCSSSDRRASGGASGEASVSSGHWVKQVRANWIRHPSYCSGAVAGSAAGSPVLVRVYAD